MLKILLYLVVAMVLPLTASIREKIIDQIPSEVTIHECLFTFSNYYEIDSTEGPYGTLVKEKLAIRTNYQYYDIEGQLTSSAYLRILSLGSLCTWAGILDVYDQDGKCLGLIEGTLLTFLPAEFSIYNEKKILVGTAYMDYDCLGFTVLDSIHEKKAIAHFRRKFVKGFTDHWVITINDFECIDFRLLYTFGAFVLDNQNDFRIDD